MKERPLFTMCLVFLVFSFFVVLTGGERFLEELKPSGMEQGVPDGKKVVLAGQVYRKEQAEEYQILYLIHNSIIYQQQSIKESKIIVYDTRKTDVKIGNIVRAEGEVSFFDSARNPGNFDQKFYYRKQNIHVRIWSSKLEVTDGQVKTIPDALLKLRQRWREILLKTAGEQDGSVLCAMILGEKNGMDAEIKELYQQNGIAHILAISGLHLSFVGAGLYQMVRKLSGSYLAGGLAGILFLGLYVLMIGMSVSAMRAVIMYIIRVGADICGRVYDAPTSLAIAAVVVILWRPLSFFDGGFQLSFGACAGIIFINPILKYLKKQNNFSGKRRKDQKKLRAGIAEGIEASISIQLVTFPILLYHFYEFPLYSLFLNLMVIPLMGVILFAGILGSAAMLVLPVAGGLLITICRWVLTLYEYLCRGAGELPLSRVITGQPKPIGIVLYYGLLLGVVLWMRRKGEEKNKEEKKGSFFKHYTLVVPAGAVLLGTTALLLFCPAWNHKGLEVTMLDVGQGDCIFVRSEELTCLIDGGSTDVKAVGRYRMEPFLKARGVTSVDLVFISHGDADHISGIAEMLTRGERSVPIKGLVLPVRKLWDETLMELAALAGEQEVKVYTMEAGEEICADALSLACIQPADEDTLVPGNEASMVLSVEYGQFSMLCTGDVEGAGESQLTSDIETLEVTVLKVAHHGSKNSTSQEFLNGCAADYALISAGRGNRYGHPHDETIQRLSQDGSRIYSTQECGAVTMYVDGTSLIMKKTKTK